jgi:hypothetical protein
MEESAKCSATRRTGMTHRQTALATGIRYRINRRSPRRPLITYQNTTSFMLTCVIHRSAFGNSASRAPASAPNSAESMNQEYSRPWISSKRSSPRRQERLRTVRRRSPTQPLGSGWSTGRLRTSDPGFGARAAGAATVTLGEYTLMSVTIALLFSASLSSDAVT